MKKIVFAGLCLILASGFCFSQVKKSNETQVQLEKYKGEEFPTVHVKEWEKMHNAKTASYKWFNDAKYGMFIHFGLYSHLGGIWKDKKVEEYKSSPHSEWIMLSAKIPRDEYAAIEKSFNPSKYNAMAIAQLAKDAGMKYIVITAKHHEGFAMYATKYSKHNIVDATPFKRDVVKELYDACEKLGLGFGVYYSHSVDWLEGSDSQVKEAIANNWNTGPANKSLCANTWDPSPNTFDEYLNNKAYPQVKELTQNLPNLKFIWYDMPPRMQPEQSWQFYKIPYSINPKVMISDRIGNGFSDYFIPGDNEIPDANLKIVKPWETCGTMNNSWGYKSYDHDWKTPREILFWAIEIISKGGNYLLNIGPNAEGEVPLDCQKSLIAAGKWMQLNGEALYGSKRWKVVKEGPTNLSIKSTAERKKKGFNDNFTPNDFWFTSKSKTIYAISIVKPEATALICSLNNSVGKIKSAEILGYGKVKFTQSEKGLQVVIPEGFRPENGYVVKVKI